MGKSTGVETARIALATIVIGIIVARAAEAILADFFQTQIDLVPNSAVAPIVIGLSAILIALSRKQAR